MTRENGDGVDGAEIHTLLLALGIIQAGNITNAKRLVDAVGQKYETTEIISLSNEGIEIVEKLIELLFDFSDLES